MSRGFILVFCLGIATAKLQYTPHEAELARAMENVVIGSKAKEGIIILHFKMADHKFEAVKEKICEVVLQNLPSHVITANNRDSFKDLPTKTDNPLIVYVMENGKTEVEFKTMIDKICRIRMHGKEKSKIVLIIVHLEVSDPIPVDFITKHARSEGILDLEIMQVSITGTVSIDNYNPIINKNNHKEFLKEKQTEYFPNKLGDINGYEINVILQTCNRFNQFIVPRYCKEDAFREWNPWYMQIMAIKDAWNIGINIIHLSTIFDSEWVENKPQSLMAHLHYLMKKNNVQWVISSGVPHPYSKSGIEYSTSIGLDKYCAVVPVIYKNRLAQSITRFLLVLAITCVMILSFWLIPKLLKFNRNVWMFMNIIRAVLGISWSQNLTRLVERMFYVIMIIGFSRFTFHFYSELVEVIANAQDRYKLDSFEDIEASPLRIVLPRITYWATYNSSTGALKKLLEKAVLQDNMNECLSSLVRFKNISCIASVTTANKWKKLQGSDVDAQVVISQACVFALPFVHYLDPQSPYVDRFNNILGRLNAAGLYNKWRNEDFNVLKSKFQPNDFKNYEEVKIPPEVLLVKSLLWLYCLPFLVFIGELLIYRLRRLFTGNN